LKATTATGFLDLPKELRDVIYRVICDQLPHLGIHWTISDRIRAKAVPMSIQMEYLRDPKNRIDMVRDLNIMQTCR
jgi:hypothetical protein